MRRAQTLILLVTGLAAFPAADAGLPRAPMWSVSAGRLGAFDDIGDPFELGAALFHLSNGGIGDRIPGTEALVLSVSLPTRHHGPVAQRDRGLADGRPSD